MKLTLLLTASVAAALIFNPAAQAQDDMSYDSNVTGFYGGVFAGYGWTDTNSTAFGDADLNGGDYGVFAGYELDDFFARKIGYGLNGSLELHFAWSDASESAVLAGVPVQFEKNHEWGFSFRPGFDSIDQALPHHIKPYGIIGYRSASFDANAGGVSGDESFGGVELGLGTQLYSFGDFGVRADYSRVWYGEESGLDPTEDDLRLGLGYQF